MPESQTTLVLRHRTVTSVMNLHRESQIKQKVMEST